MSRQVHTESTATPSTFMNGSSSDGLAWSEELALANVDGDTRLLRELLEIWLRQAPQLIAASHSALESQDAKQLRLAAHSLRGSLQIVVAHEAEEGAEMLERSAKEGLLAACAPLLAKLEADIRVLTLQIREYLDQNP